MAMFAALAEPAPVTPGQEEPAFVGLSQTIMAVRGLARVDEAYLLAHDRSTARLSVAAGPSTIGPHGAAMLAAVDSFGGMMFQRPQARWVQEGDGDSEATLLLRVGERGPTSFFLALKLADSRALERARVATIAADLALLVASRLEAEHRFADLESQQKARSAALDHNECAVIAVRDDHTVLFMNAAASAMVSQGAGLQVKRGVLRPQDHRSAVRFEAALDAVQGGLASGATGKARGLVMMLPTAGSKRPMIAVIVPPSERASPIRDGEAAAFVYLMEPAQGAVLGLDILAELHGLSRVETRLTAHLYAGLTLTEAAVKMRIKVETARAYLKQVFAKTSTHRQADLITLMSRYLRAVHGDFEFSPA